MKVSQAFGGLEHSEFVIVNDVGNFYAPPKGRYAKYKSKWVSSLQNATVYKTYTHADKIIVKNKLSAKYLSLKEAQQEFGV